MTESESSSISSSISEKSTPSLSTTVSNCTNGRLTRSRSKTSGVNEILLRPSMIIRSPVFTSTLARALTADTLKVPKPFIFTELSVSSSSSFTTSNIAPIKSEASLSDKPYLSLSSRAKSFTLAIRIISFLHLVLHRCCRLEVKHDLRWNEHTLPR